MRKIIFLFILFGFSCTNTFFFANLNKGHMSYDIPIELSSYDSIVFEGDMPLRFEVVFSNNESKEVDLLKYSEVTTGQNPMYFWHIIIIYEDGTLMRSPLLLIHRVSEGKKYIKIEPSEEFRFEFDIDFNDLRSEYENLVKKMDNIRFGNYYILLYYQDTLCQSKRAIENILTSNILKIQYLKKE